MKQISKTLLFADKETQDFLRYYDFTLQWHLHFCLHKYMHFKSKWTPVASVKLELNPNVAKIGPGTLVLSSTCFVHKIFPCAKQTNKKNIYIYTRNASHLSVSLLTIISYPKEWIQGNCDRANEFSQLFCHFAESIKLGFGSVFPNLREGERMN